MLTAVPHHIAIVFIVYYVAIYAIAIYVRTSEFKIRTEKYMDKWPNICLTIL